MLYFAQLYSGSLIWLVAELVYGDSIKLVIQLLSTCRFSSTILLAASNGVFEKQPAGLEFGCATNKTGVYVRSPCSIVILTGNHSRLPLPVCGERRRNAPDPDVGNG